MNSGKFRSKKTYFTQVSNNALRNQNLSLKAKGLYALINSYITIEGFTLYKSMLIKQSKDGKSAFESTWKELKEAGYLVQYKLKDENGKFYYEYELLDEPTSDLPHTDFQGMEKQGTGKATSRKAGQYNNTDLNNTELNNTYINKQQKEKQIKNNNRPVKTRFHNIHESFREYEPEELNNLIKQTQADKFGNDPLHAMYLRAIKNGLDSLTVPAQKTVLDYAKKNNLELPQ